MIHNTLKIAALSLGLVIISSAASATPLGSASKAALVVDGSEAGVQLVHRRHVRRHFRRQFHGPSVSFGFGLHPYGHYYPYGYPYGGIHHPGFSFGLSVPLGHGHHGFMREGPRQRGF